MSEAPKNEGKYTLCWDCSKATGGCRWSDDLRPVKGWTIIPTRREIYGGATYKSCIVLDCPGFVRDAVGGGAKRYKDGEIIDPMRRNS